MPFIPARWAPADPTVSLGRAPLACQVVAVVAQVTMRRESEKQVTGEALVSCILR